MSHTNKINETQSDDYKCSDFVSANEVAPGKLCGHLYIK